MNEITILGGGPAGSSAALSALAEGSRVTLVDRASFPRHKVCGEFFSPEIAPHLDQLGMWDRFQAAQPAPVRRLALHFGAKCRETKLPETAWGLSRFAFDALMLEAACQRGALLMKESHGPSNIVTTGRPASKMPRGQRLFGFKAHFEGPPHDAVELFFFRGGYIGITAIEKGRTNVCGLAQEDSLGEFGFDYDEFVRQCPALRARIAPMLRSMEWISTGPLEYRQAFDRQEAVYRAGDALSFVDPFTGSGLLSAVKTGILAGRAAAQEATVDSHLHACRVALKKPFLVSSMLRRIVNTGWADRLAGFVPGRLLFAATRPR